MAAIEPYLANRVESAYEHALAVTPSDSAELLYFSSALYVGGAGHLTVITMSGETVEFRAVPVGTVIKLRVKQVLSTGTTATFIVALW